MKNIAGLPMLDVIEKKQKDKDFKRAKAKNALKTKAYYKGFNSGFYLYNPMEFEPIEDRLDVISL